MIEVSEELLHEITAEMHIKGLAWDHDRVVAWIEKVLARRGCTPPTEKKNQWHYWLKEDELLKLKELVCSLPLKPRVQPEGLDDDELETLVMLIAYCDNKAHFADLKNMGATPQQLESAILKALTPGYYNELDNAPRSLKKQKQLILQWKQELS